jgi:RNA polymerase sigma-70 factor (ECF subfamily)
MTPSNAVASDLALLQRMAGGDRAALQTLFARHYTRVYRFAMRQVRSEEMAEEIANDVFLESWRQAGRFEGRSAVSTWLLAIAYNKARMALRSRKIHVSDDDYLIELQDGADNPEMVKLKADKARAIRTLTERLSPEQRAVIDLVYYHEKGLREVADILDIPENTVKTRLFHARKRLADLIIAAGIDWEWP